MAESKLRTLSIDFAVQILNLVKFLKSQHKTILSNQIGRAGIIFSNPAERLIFHRYLQSAAETVFLRLLLRETAEEQVFPDVPEALQSISSLHVLLYSDVLLQQDAVFRSPPRSRRQSTKLSEERLQPEVS